MSFYPVNILSIYLSIASIVIALTLQQKFYETRFCEKADYSITYIVFTDYQRVFTRGAYRMISVDIFSYF